MFTAACSVVGDLLTAVREIPAQAFRQIDRHADSPLGIQPEMGVDLPVIIRLQQQNAFGSIHDRQVRICAGHDREEGFHSGTVDQQDVRFGQGDHVGILQRIVVQAAGGRLGQVGDGDSVNAFGQIQGHQPDRIKAGHDRFRGGRQGTEQRQKQQDNKGFLHENPPMISSEADPSLRSA